VLLKKYQMVTLIKNSTFIMNSNVKHHDHTHNQLHQIMIVGILIHSKFLGQTDHCTNICVLGFCSIFEATWNSVLKRRVNKKNKSVLVEAATTLWGKFTCIIACLCTSKWASKLKA
jgi:hypothetical protein